MAEPFIDLDNCAYLAFDLGANCGWALGIYRKGLLKIESGCLDLSPSKVKAFETGSMRFVRFENELIDLEKRIDVPVRAVGYESVHVAHKGAQAAHDYGGYKAILQLWAEKRGIALTGLFISEIKKFATGSGNAGKEAMVAAASARAGRKIENDNEADAYHVLRLLIDRHHRTTQE